MKRLKYFALAALVAFAACDEGDEVVVPDPVTGTISGVVSIDGSGAEGVTVTLSSGATATTGANGSYQLTNVAEGSYTVTISGFPSDAAFPTTSKAAVIATAGQVQTVDFNGSFITTSSIFVSLIRGPQVGPLTGATVSLTGMSSATATTDSTGTVSFSGLRAGDYTVSVTLSAGNAALYDLDASSKDVTLGLDDNAAVSFTATAKTISTITGRLFIDENSKNDLYDANSEENLSVANISISVEGVSVGVFDTIQTAADGTFEIMGLPAANYRVAVVLTDPQIPAAVTYGASDGASRVFTLGVADTEVVEFPFDITTQQITVGAFLGADESAGPAGVASRVTPLSGISIRLYPTQADAAGLTNSLAVGSTTSTGLRTLSFSRANDTDPFGGPSDNVVFARVTGGVPGTFTQNGEAIIEIPFPAGDSLTVAGDVFDYLNSTVVLGLRIQEIDMDRYAGIRARLDTDTSTVLDQFADSDADGLVYFTVTTPDVYFTRVQKNIQPNLPTAGIPNWPSPFTAIYEDSAASEFGTWLRYNHDGTTLPADTIFLGTSNISWDVVDVRGRMHRETNDSSDVPTWQTATETGHAATNLTNVVLQQDNNGTWQQLGPILNPNAGTGAFFNNMVASGETYRYIASPQDPTTRAVLNDTIVTFDVDGGDQIQSICPLRTAGTTTYATCSTFALKFETGTITGNILYRDGSAVAGLPVRIAPADSTIQGRASTVGDTTVTTNGAGEFTTNATVREGFYTVTPVTSAPTRVYYASTNGGVKVVDIQNAGDIQDVPRVDTNGTDGVALSGDEASFHAFYESTSIEGVVVNDRDQDGNTIDVDEALIGSVVTLYADDTGSFTVSSDSIVAVDTIGVDGAYSFTSLRDGRYRVSAATVAGETVIPAPGTGYTVTTDFANVEGSRFIGDDVPTTLPFWDYTTSMITNPSEPGAPESSYFTFLFNDGRIQGNITNDDGSGGVDGITLTIVRCATEAPLPLVPTIGTCDSAAPGTFINTQTDASGDYLFENLREGIYQVTIQPGSGGDGDGPFTGATFGGAAATTVVALVDGRTDLETVDFVVSN